MDFKSPSKTSKWVCPNDRYLALCGKLNSGWSVKSYEANHYERKLQPLTEQEQETIKEVIERAETLDRREQERIGRLVDKLDCMKKNVLGNGTSECILCGDHFGLFHASGYLCTDCKRMVCVKCGVELTNDRKEPIWLCKICSETRETWKKSGAWFFRGIPKYVLPKEKDPALRKQSRPGLEKNTWSKLDFLESNSTTFSKLDSETSSLSDDDSTSETWAKKSAVTKSKNRGKVERLKSFREEAAMRSPSGVSSASSTLFFNTSTDSGVGGDNERNILMDMNTIRDKSNSKEISEGSSESNLSSTASRKSSSITSETSHMLVVQPEGPIGRLSSAFTGHDYLKKKINYDLDYPLRSANHRLRPDSSSEFSIISTDTDRHKRESSDSKQPRRQWMSVESDIDALDSVSVANYSMISSSCTERDSQVSPAAKGYDSDDLSSTSSSTVYFEDVPTGTRSTTANFTCSTEISFRYDAERCVLQCCLHCINGLKGTDYDGLADPFCKLTIMPYTGQPHRLRSKTVHKSVNPEFNENFTFYGITDTDISEKYLHLLVLDDDVYGNDPLGEARIPLSKVRSQKNKRFRMGLEAVSCNLDVDKNSWTQDVGNRGQIFLSLCYSTQKKALVIFISKCINLLPMDSNGFSDPFIKLPDTSNKKLKSSVKWKNLNPIFNEEFIFETRIDKLSKQTLVLTVWDKDYRKKNDYLGGLELGKNSKGGRLKQWMDMLKYPNRSHEACHRLGELAIID